MLREQMVSTGTILAALTETHLSPEVLDAEIYMEGFDIYRADRANNRSGGGVAIYLKRELAAGTSLICSDSNGVVEYLMIHIKKHNMVVMNVYRPPTTTELDFVPVLRMLRAKFLALNDPSLVLVLCGDFNMPRTNWNLGHTEGGTGEERRQASHLLEVRDELLMNQIIEVPTRGDNILDLFFTNNEDLIMKVEVVDSIMSDHRMILVGLTVGFDTDEESMPMNRNGLNNLNFFHNNTEWEKILDVLGDVNWSNTFQHLSLDEKYNVFMDKLLEVCSRFVPERIIRPKLNKIPRDRRILMKKRGKLNKRLLDVRGEDAKNRIRADIAQIENRISHSHMQEIRKNEADAVRAIKENVKYFYQYAKHKSKIKVSVGPLEDGEEITADPARMCDLLKTHYETVFTEPLPAEDLAVMREETRVPEHFKLEDIVFSEEDFVEASRSLKNNSAAGPDGVPALLLKKAIQVLAEPLCHIWKESMRLGKIPEALKKGRITPIYKGGNRGKRQNYRGVALTSHCIKLFEKIIVRKMVDYMETHNLYNKGQHGFRAGHSCLSQLLAHYQEILEEMSNGHCVDVVYLDFAKAFDKVDHGVLEEKLRRIGISGQLLGWIGDFLRGRSQHVAVGGVISGESSVVSGVPQGSVLGPLLFLVHIGDLTDAIHNSTVSSFADDTRIVKSIKTIEDCELLQRDLDEIYEWAKHTNMFFNGTKFVHLRYGAPGEAVAYNYRSSESSIVPENSETTDLGVIMTNTASFKDHIGLVAAKGRQRLGWILRVFMTRESAPLLTLYKALVLPILEYCCQLWCPTTIGMIRQLEAVQRTFTSRIAGLARLDYWERLRALKLYSLERRRERYIVIYVWKIIQGISPNFEGRTRIQTVNSERRGILCLVPSLVRTRQRIMTLRESSFPILGPRLYNCIPPEVRACNGSLDVFKSKLDNFLQSVPDRPCMPGYYQDAALNSILVQVAYRRAEGES